MGEAKRRKHLDPRFGAAKSSTLHPIFHSGIEKAVKTLLRMIQIAPLTGGGQKIAMLTNDIPDHPDEVSMGFTAMQIEELRRWVKRNPDRIPQNIKIRVLPMENCVHKGRVWKYKDFPHLLIDL